MLKMEKKKTTSNFKFTSQNIKILELQLQTKHEPRPWNLHVNDVILQTLEQSGVLKIKQDMSVNVL